MPLQLEELALFFPHHIFLVHKQSSLVKKTLLAKNLVEALLISMVFLSRSLGGPSDTRAWGGCQAWWEAGSEECSALCAGLRWDRGPVCEGDGVREHGE